LGGIARLILCLRTDPCSHGAVSPCSFEMRASALEYLAAAPRTTPRHSGAATSGAKRGREAGPVATALCRRVRLRSARQRAGMPPRLILDANDLPLPGPLVGRIAEPGTDRILTDIFPFFRIALAAPQNVIKKALLPMRTRLPARVQRLSQCIFQRLHPPRQPDARVGKRDEQVDMIGHQNIAAHRDVVLAMRPRTEDGERLVNRPIVQNAAPVPGIECDEVKRADVLKEFDPGRTSGKRVAHQEKHRARASRRTNVFVRQRAGMLGGCAASTPRHGGAATSNAQRDRDACPVATALCRRVRLRSAPARWNAWRLRREHAPARRGGYIERPARPGRLPCSHGAVSPCSFEIRAPARWKSGTKCDGMAQISLLRVREK